MFDQARLSTTATALHYYFNTHGEALQNAALLLGGRKALARTQRLLDDIRCQPELTRRMNREVIALHDLLTLQHVHEDLVAAECFGSIDPGSPAVEEICLLADGLDEAIEEAGIGIRTPFGAWQETASSVTGVWV